MSGGAAVQCAGPRGRRGGPPLPDGTRAGRAPVVVLGTPGGVGARGGWTGTRRSSDGQEGGHRRSQRNAPARCLGGPAVLGGTRCAVSACPLKSSLSASHLVGPGGDGSSCGGDGFGPAPPLRPCARRGRCGVPLPPSARPSAQANRVHRRDAGGPSLGARRLRPVAWCWCRPLTRGGGGAVAAGRRPWASAGGVVPWRP